MARRTIGTGIGMALAASAGVGAGPPPEPQPQDVRDTQALLAAAPKAVLRQGDLSLTVALPDPKIGFYRGTRFDWAGMVSALTLGSTHFYGAWFDGVAANLRDFVDEGSRVIASPQTGATGPAEEFVASGSNPTPGYAEAAVGGSFVKIGVGRLRKPDDAPYNRFRAYQIISGGDWTVDRHRDRIGFHQHLAADASGYGYDYEKELRLEPGNVLVISHRLRNIGTKPITTEVYNHNFMRFDEQEIASGTEARFPYPLQGPSSAPALASVEGSTLRYLKPLAVGDHVTLDIKGLPADVSASAFTVAAPNGATIHAQADTPLAHAMLWSVRRVVAVEPFIAIDLAPGAEKRWSWRYTYTAGK